MVSQAVFTHYQPLSDEAAPGWPSMVNAFVSGEKRTEFPFTENCLYSFVNNQRNDQKQILLLRLFSNFALHLYGWRPVMIF